MTTKRGYRVCSRCHKSRNVKFFAPRGRICKACQKDGTAQRSKDTRLQETYGITIGEWHLMLAAQGGCCAICKGKRAQYDVDHDHKMEKELKSAGIADLIATRMSVRGLLCKRCNRRLLPASLDNPVILDSAKSYLGDPPAHQTLSGSLP